MIGSKILRVKLESEVYLMLPLHYISNSDC